MNIIATSNHPQGASFSASHAEFSADLWKDHTPVYKNKSIGTIGNCQINNSPEASQFLSDCAEFLNHHHNCETVVGPMNGNTWLNHRLTLESDGRDPFFMEPNEPALFHNTFTAAGFEILSKYSSSLIDLTCQQKDYTSLAKRFHKQEVSIRAIDPAHFKRDLTSIYHLSLTCFSNNFLYTPISAHSFIGKYMQSKEHITPELVLLAERDGALVGYVFCIPDLLALKHKKKPALIVKTLAVLPERALAGLGTLLVAKTQNIAQSIGYTQSIHALQYENNSSLRISHRFDAHRFRRYALMAKHF